MFEIRRYTPDQADEWNSFAATSKNATFLFDRRYMDYHQERFEDCSLMIYHDARLHALLPANRKGDTFFSHEGLTYGGLLMNERNTAAETVTLFDELNAFLRRQGFGKVRYKCIPAIYHRLPAEEDLYAIYRTADARLSSRSIGSVIDMQHRLKWSHGRRYGINRCRNNGVVIVCDSDKWEGFWQVLEENLKEKHHAVPVHTLQEIRLLKARFPNNIILCTGQQNGQVIGGTVLYLTPRVVHAQYISANAAGKKLGVIDALYDQILSHECLQRPYFDFGISTEDHGRILNESLIYQKEGFGGRGVCYDWYDWEL